MENNGIKLFNLNLTPILLEIKEEVESKDFGLIGLQANELILEYNSLNEKEITDENYKSEIIPLFKEFKKKTSSLKKGINDNRTQFTRKFDTIRTMYSESENYIGSLGENLLLKASNYGTALAKREEEQRETARKKAEKEKEIENIKIDYEFNIKQMFSNFLSTTKTKILEYYHNNLTLENYDKLILSIDKKPVFSYTIKDVAMRSYSYNDNDEVALITSKIDTNPLLKSFEKSYISEITTYATDIKLKMIAKKNDLEEIKATRDKEKKDALEKQSAEREKKEADLITIRESALNQKDILVSEMKKEQVEIKQDIKIQSVNTLSDLKQVETPFITTKEELLICINFYNKNKILKSTDTIEELIKKNQSAVNFVETSKGQGISVVGIKYKPRIKL